MNEELLKKYEPKPLQVLKVDQVQLLAVRFSCDGNRLVASGFDGQVHRWNLQTEDKEAPNMAAVGGHNGWVTGLQCHPTQPVSYSTDSWGKLQAWNNQEEQPQPLWQVDAAHDGWIQCLAISRDGQLLATCGNDGHVRVWQTGDGKPLHDFPANPHEVYCVAFHPDGGSLVSGDLLGQISDWDLKTGKLERTLDAGVFYALSRLQDVGGLRCLSFDREGKTLVAGGAAAPSGGTVQGEPTALLFDWKSGKIDKTVVFGAKSECFLQEALLLPDNILLGVTSGVPGNGRFSVFAIGEDKPFFQGKGMMNCHSLALDPAGRRIAVVTTSPGSNGNGRNLKDGEYRANDSPIHLLELPA